MLRQPPEPRRVLLLVNKLGGGGAERDVTLMCQHADPSRFAFEVWTLVPGGDLEPLVHEAGIPVHCLDRKHAFGPVFALRAAREIAKARFDLIHAFLPAIAFNAALAKVVWRTRTPLIYSELSALPKKGFKSNLRRWSLRHFTACFANSLGSQRYLELSGIDSSKIRLVRNGHDVTRYCNLSSPRDQVRGSVGVGRDDALAIFAGRLIPSKRVCDLLDAVALLHNEYPRLRAVVAGEGPELKRLQQQSAALGLESKVHFAGRRLDIPDLLQVADLFIFPSETEGLSNSVIEAALVGLPTVACDIGGVREIVCNGEGAYLVPCRQPQALANKIARVLDNPEEARQRARLSRQAVESDYAIQNVMQRLYTNYEEVLHAQSRRSES